MSDSKEQLLPSEPPPSYELAAQTQTPARGPLPPPPPLELPVLTQLRNQRVVLASASPRRKQLLAHLGLGHAQIVPSRVPEDLPKSLSPFEYVLQTATQKALSVYRQEVNNESADEPALLVAADTIVVSHVGAILEKPRSEKEHLAMLRTLREGPSHKVFTAVAVMTPLESAIAPGYALETSVEETVVWFDSSITDDLLMAYVRTREGADKAGGYGIQGTGSVLIERIEGTFDNVVGLPLRTTLRLIEKVMATGELSAQELAEREEPDEE
ncbi:MAG: hypothetical protein M1823_004812 [Watsoniomyces obsoletus]|nr:MAG: hypothetical protein M1823_004812 [Watsoniomyces obsoletus]